MESSDWPAVARIYQEGLDTGHASFENQAPSWENWDEEHLKSCRCVALYKEETVGWAALTPISGRCVYAGVAEVSVYVSRQHRGLKIGSSLLQWLIDSSESEGIWTLQAGMFPSNEASLGLHESLGFRHIGYREKIGQLRGVWVDTLLLERRSRKVNWNTGSP